MELNQVYKYHVEFCPICESKGFVKTANSNKKFINCYGCGGLPLIKKNG